MGLGLKLLIQLALWSIVMRSRDLGVMISTYKRKAIIEQSSNIKTKE